MDFYEEPIAKSKVYEGLIINVRRDTVRLVNSKEVTREIVEHPGGVAVVPVTAEGKVLCVRQYRYSMSAELLEIPAGKLERGENHYGCAVRELSEETGCKAGKMIYLGAVYPSPGYCEEILHIYLALDLEYGKMHLDEDEFLSVEPIALDSLINMIMENRLSDAKTVIGLLKATLYLDRNS